MANATGNCSVSTNLFFFISTGGQRCVRLLDRIGETGNKMDFSHTWESLDPSLKYVQNPKFGVPPAKKNEVSYFSRL